MARCAYAMILRSCAEHQRLRNRNSAVRRHRDQIGHATTTPLPNVAAQKPPSGIRLARPAGPASVAYFCRDPVIFRLVLSSKAFSKCYAARTGCSSAEQAPSAFREGTNKDSSCLRARSGPRGRRLSKDTAGMSTARSLYESPDGAPRHAVNNNSTPRGIVTTRSCFWFRCQYPVCRQAVHVSSRGPGSRAAGAYRQCGCSRGGESALRAVDSCLLSEAVGQYES